MEDNKKESQEKETFAADSPELKEGATAVEAPASVESEGQDFLKELQEEKEALQDKYARLAAEFDNYKRRTNKDLLELTQMGGKRVILEMLSVLDDMERAERQIQQSTDVAALQSGMALIFEKFRKTLEKQGVKKLESKHKPFNTEFHEAITEVPVAEEAQKNTVIEVMSEGYFLHDKLIRFAKVVVGK